MTDDIAGNEYLDHQAEERFVVKRVEDWGFADIAIMEYEDGTPYDQPANWVRNDCTLLDEDVAPVDLNFYTDEGLETKAANVGMDFGEAVESDLNGMTAREAAEYFRDTVRKGNVTNDKNRTLPEELERFQSAGYDPDDALKHMWNGFAEFAVDLGPVSPPDTKNEIEQNNQIATE